tara:strand:- start:2714 stop:3850 length:1137 start_codon:yes stop_codon:yes gene_type:complete
MNIILIFTFGISLKDWQNTGLITRELKIYESLNEKYGFTFTFITFGDQEDVQIAKDIDFINVIPSQTIVSFTKSRFLNFFKSLILPYKIKKYLKNADLIKTNQLSGSWIGIILKFMLKKPLLVRTGYDVLQFKINERKPKYIIVFYFILTQLCLIFSDIFSVTSIEDKLNMQKRFLGSENILINRNYVLHKYEKPFNERYQNKIIVVGRLEKQKNYIQLLESLKGINCTIDIVGDGSERKKIEKLIENSNLDVNLLGILSNDDLVNLMKNYKIFLSGSLYEGSPKSTLEAMSSGALIVAFENSNISEIIESYENGILFNDFKLLPEIIRDMIQNEKKFDIMTKRAYLKIEDEYSLESAIKREIKIYNLITKSRKNLSL